MSDLDRYLCAKYGIRPDDDSIYITVATRDGKVWIYWPARNILMPIAARYRKLLVVLHYFRIASRGAGIDPILGGFQPVDDMIVETGYPETTIRKYIANLRRALRDMDIEPDDVVANCDMPGCFGYRLGPRVIVLLDAREELPPPQDARTM